MTCLYNDLLSVVRKAKTWLTHLHMPQSTTLSRSLEIKTLRNVQVKTTTSTDSYVSNDSSFFSDQHKHNFNGATKNETKHWTVHFGTLNVCNITVSKQARVLISSKISLAKVCWRGRMNLGCQNLHRWKLQHDVAYTCTRVNTVLEYRK